MGTAQVIISQERAEEYGWFEEAYKASNFTERYNKSQEDKKIFVCAIGEKLPEYLVCINLEGAILEGAVLENAVLLGSNLRGAILEDANLRGADLKDTDLTDADLTDADLTNAKISDFSLLEEIKKLRGVCFKNTQIYKDGDLLDIEPSRKIIIDRLVKLEIRSAKGLGDEYQAALADAGLLDEPFEAHNESEVDIPPSLAAAGFEIASKVSTTEENITNDSSLNANNDLDTNDFNPS